MKSKSLLLLVAAGVVLLGFYVATTYFNDEQAEGALIYKTPSCSCCSLYAKYLASKGYNVELVDVNEKELEALKARLGVPRQLWSCHTMVIDGYIIEGHVPVESIRKLIEGRPVISGISVPGMPPGSPGMPGEPRKLVVYGFFRDVVVGVFDVVKWSP